MLQRVLLLWVCMYHLKCTTSILFSFLVLFSLLLARVDDVLLNKKHRTSFLKSGAKVLHLFYMELHYITKVHSAMFCYILNFFFHSPIVPLQLLLNIFGVTISPLHTHESATLHGAMGEFR